MFDSLDVSNLPLRPDDSFLIPKEYANVYMDWKRAQNVDWILFQTATGLAPLLQARLDCMTDHALRDEYIYYLAILNRTHQTLTHLEDQHEYDMAEYKENKTRLLDQLTHAFRTLEEENFSQFLVELLREVTPSGVNPHRRLFSEDRQLPPPPSHVTDAAVQTENETPIPIPPPALPTVGLFRPYNPRHVGFRCHHCGQMDHFVYECREFRCYRCDTWQPGHYLKGCPSPFIRTTMGRIEHVPTQPSSPNVPRTGPSTEQGTDRRLRRHDSAQRNLNPNRATPPRRPPGISRLQQENLDFNWELDDPDGNLGGEW